MSYRCALLSLIPAQSEPKLIIQICYLFFIASRLCMRGIYNLCVLLVFSFLIKCNFFPYSFHFMCASHPHIQLSFSPTTPGWSHFRLVGLLSSILVASGFMFIICVGVGIFGGFNTFAFMAAEASINIGSLILILLCELVRYLFNLISS